MCVSYSGFEIIPTTVSVVVVYPAETPAFQRAVVSLAEFLQWHGGCRVAIDLWQQEKIAKLGPLRWLAELVKDADRVLIISPQGENVSCVSIFILQRGSPVLLVEIRFSLLVAILYASKVYPHQEAPRTFHPSYS